MNVKKLIQSVLRVFGLGIHSTRYLNLDHPVEFNEEDQKIITTILDKELSMCSVSGLYATALACKYVLENEIEGGFIECGVWRGGNSLLAADIFHRANQSRRVDLFDTFLGMSEPTEDDVSLSSSEPAIRKFEAHQSDGKNTWCYASLEDVRRNFQNAELLSDAVSFVKGDVCMTLKDEANLPDKIAVLRLDTDWYESTKTELEVLYPRLSPGGVLIIDDYGHWAGAKKATDEYFKQHDNRPFLQLVDSTRRMGVKPG